IPGPRPPTPIRLLLLVRPWWRQLALTIALGVGHTVSSILLGVVGALLVGRVATHWEVGPLLWVLGALVPLAAVLTWAESWQSHDLAYRLLGEMRIDLYARLDPLAPGYLHRRRTGDLAGIVTADVEAVELFFAHAIAPAVVAVLVPAGVLLWLATIALPLALVLLPFLAAVALSPFAAAGRMERLGAEMRRRLGELNAHMVDHLQGLREILAFGRESRRLQEVEDRSRTLIAAQLAFRRQTAFQNSFVEACTGLGGLAVMATAASSVAAGAIPATMVPVATLLALATFQPVSNIARVAKELADALAAGRRVFAVHDEPVPVRDGVGAPQGAGGAPAVELDGVGFAYGPGEPPALANVTFAVEPGQTVALVGRSGAGKTTVAHLLLRFWDSQAGAIRLGGHDLRRFGLDALRRQIALVSQDTYLFNATVADNIRLGRPDAGDAEVETAARRANAHEFISRLPDGYRTLAGERGLQLSGGQRQRIAIARALLKDAPVLILDEATSHLDAENELQVRQALARLMAGRTTVVIAHRLSTVRDADRIVVLDAGRVAEQGTHDELLDRGGVYAALVAAQVGRSAVPSLG
ncbi:MAG: thiol reductant ABC exporter subunit CydC, partial [Chloroflexi bacterium]|nr:thiol reductant ABC exporter subunit CydC [Chloroflexota bacterium]